MKILNKTANYTTTRQTRTNNIINHHIQLKNYIKRTKPKWKYYTKQKYNTNQKTNAEHFIKLPHIAEK